MEKNLLEYRGPRPSEEPASWGSLEDVASFGTAVVSAISCVLIAMFSTPLGAGVYALAAFALGASALGFGCGLASLRNQATKHWATLVCVSINAVVLLPALVAGLVVIILMLR
jgi:hypothetical protein